MNISRPGRHRNPDQEENVFERIVDTRDEARQEAFGLRLVSSASAIVGMGLYAVGLVIATRHGAEANSMLDPNFGVGLAAGSLVLIAGSSLGFRQANRESIRAAALRERMVTMVEEHRREDPYDLPALYRQQLTGRWW